MRAQRLNRSRAVKTGDTNRQLHFPDQYDEAARYSEAFGRGEDAFSFEDAHLQHVFAAERVHSSLLEQSQHGGSRPEDADSAMNSSYAFTSARTGSVVAEPVSE
jgi:hypothetical protein